MPMGYTRATRVAAGVGQALAVVFGFFGLLGNPLLVLIAVFIFLAASGEAGYVQARDYMRGYLAGQAMISEFQTLAPGATADEAAALLLRTTQQEFPVVDGGGHSAGHAHQERPDRRPDGHRRGDAGLRHDAEGRADRAAQRLPRQHLHAAAARAAHGRRGRPRRRLVGYITAENLAELVMIQSSRSARGAEPAPAPLGARG